MDFQVRISEAALAEFEDILSYCWANFPATAEQFGNAILDHVELLKRFPYIGRLVTGSEDVRELVHTPILIHYRVHRNPNIVEVLHFRHSSRSDHRIM